MANVAKGSTISWNTTAIPEIDSFNGASLTHEALDVTDLDSTGKDYLPAGVYDAGELSLELNYDPDDTVHAAMVTDLIAGTERAVVVTMQNTGTAATSTWTFQGLCTAFTPGGSQGDKLTTSVTIKGTGTMTPA